LTDRSTWTTQTRDPLKELSDLVLDFDIEAIGFEPPEIDGDPIAGFCMEEADDQFELPPGL
jgi:hypothetical protein